MKTVSAFHTDADLVAGCRQGHAAAQKQLYHRFAPKMLGVCRRYLRHELDAEDALARGFAKVFRCLHQFEGSGSLEGWVRRIVVHEALGALRRRAAVTLPLDDCATAHLACTLPATDAALHAADLLQLVQALPAGYRAVFNLYALEGYSHPEIGALLGITEGTSKSQLSRARAMLQRQVASLHSSFLIPNSSLRHAA